MPSTNPPEIRAHDFVMDTVLSPWTELGQGLVKRRADCTREQFSERWLKHAAKVTPWGLENGIKYYAQIHNPQIAPGVAAPADLNISEWDGAAEIIVERAPDFISTVKSNDYYQKVLIPHERTFLLSEALQHIRRVNGGTVVGDKLVIIQDGKAMINCEEDMKIWREWPSQPEKDD